MRSVVQSTPRLAPALRVTRWLNTPQALTLEALRGRVVVLHTFQMLCPACVSHGLPQATRTHEFFERKDVVVIGLHTVFEHHAVMNEAALQAFIHEYRLAFPIGIDAAADDDPVPLTMQAYGLRGTPSVVLIDRVGRVRLNHFGRIDDMALGALIGQVAAEAPPAGAAPALSVAVSDTGRVAPPGCDDTGCPLP